MVLDRLLPLRDEKYVAFQRKLLPTLKPDLILGVRTPALRDLAKEMRNTQEAEDFLSALPHKTFEENQLHAFLIAETADFEKALGAVNAFLPYVDNWATCDQLRPKAFKKEKERLLSAINVWLCSMHPYTIRFGIEMLMCHFMDEAFDTAHLEQVAAVTSQAYYVKMMVAWYFATALTKQYNAALPYIENRLLDPWTHNKAIQKARESRCIPQERKEHLASCRVRDIQI